MRNARYFYDTFLSGASYNNSYVYTHLGQLWQGPLNGSGSQQQYLYCTSQPHELTGLYGTGATCANKTGQVYASSYDSWGNVTSRTYSGTTATLTYDLLDHFVSWNAGAQNKDLYIYDASGTRVLRRTTTSSGTTMTVYAFGLEEHSYFNSGGHKSDLYYYTLGGRLLGALDNSGKTTFYLTDALGSVLASFSSAAGIAAIKGNQVFGPYGNARDFQGTINTAKGFTGQYNDSLTGLDYYGSRYYDQVAGVFLSADIVHGNGSGANPYAYVGGNPETLSDPTGQMFVPPGGGGSSSPSSIVQPVNAVLPTSTAAQGGSQPCRDIGCASSILARLGYLAAVNRFMNANLAMSVCAGYCFTTIGNGLLNSTTYYRGETGVPLTYCPPPFQCSDQHAHEGEDTGMSGHDMPDVSAADTGGGAAGNPGEETSDTGETSNGLLYRALRPDENPALGLVAKDPNAAEPIWSHVLNGSKPWFNSQYISTSRSLASALEFAARRGGFIAEINESQVIGDIIDISTPEGARAQGLGGKAYSLARHWQEVLIRGYIPPEAINWVLPVSDFMLF